MLLEQLKAKKVDKMVRVFEMEPPNTSGAVLSFEGEYLSSVIIEKAKEKAKVVRLRQDARNADEYDENRMQDEMIDVMIPAIYWMKGMTVRVLATYVVLDVEAVKQMGGLDAPITLDPAHIPADVLKQVEAGKIDRASAAADARRAYESNMRFILKNCLPIWNKVLEALTSLQYFQDATRFGVLEKNSETGGGTNTAVPQSRPASLVTAVSAVNLSSDSSESRPAEPAPST